ncbi:hypothetical protein PMAYCL1PPCAC_07007, partial [Pristionchus mayeri]
KNGKKYRFGEEWTNDHMRYKCAEWGMYDITGCVIAKGRRMEKGEIHVDGHIIRACTQKGNSVGFKESICGMWGAPECIETEKKWREESKEGIPPFTSSPSHQIRKGKNSSPPLKSTWKKSSPFKSQQPKVEWFTSNNGKVSNGKISSKSKISWEPEVTNLRTVTRVGKVVDTPISLDTLTLPV